MTGRAARSARTARSPQTPTCAPGCGRPATAQLLGPVVSADVLGGRWPDAVALDLSTAALLAVAARHDVAAACVLAVTDASIDPGVFERAETELGRVAAAAF